MTTTTANPGTAAATQASSAFSAVSTFFLNKANATSGSFPEVKDLVLSLDNADIASFAAALSSMGPSFQVGGAVESVHLVAGIQREYALLSKSKEVYFQEASSDNADDATHFQESNARFTSLIKGISSEMSSM